ncbi:PspC domain-containing protein [Wukongibacter baidiensis]|uniref:PspC domain-containing protein n=1 Tax=Wukongibacter baidiensis TaxID=1723361 RepID=UPI003D7F2895
MSKKLYRSRDDKMIAGVCGGIADYFAIDTALVRILWVLITFLGGAGIIAYIICAFVFPEGSRLNGGIDDGEYIVGAKNYDGEYFKDEKNDGEKNKVLAGSILIALGVLFLVKRYVYWFDFGKLWPVILIIVGGYVIYKGKERD